MRKLSLWAAVAAACLALLFVTHTASAQQAQCGTDRETILKDLASRYKERLVWQGLDARGAIVKVFASARGNFTILITRPDGLICMASHGKDHEFIPAAKTGRGS